MTWRLSGSDATCTNHRACAQLFVPATAVGFKDLLFMTLCIAHCTMCYDTMENLQASNVDQNTLAVSVAENDEITACPRTKVVQLFSYVQTLGATPEAW